MDKKSYIHTHTDTDTHNVILAIKKEKNIAICNIIDGIGRYYIKYFQQNKMNNIQIQVYVESKMKNKQKKNPKHQMNKQLSRNKLIDTDHKYMAARGERGGGQVIQVREIRRYKLPNK